MDKEELFMALMANWFQLNGWRRYLMASIAVNWLDDRNCS